jgi:hypothetical protein
MKITYPSAGAYRGAVAWAIKRQGLLNFGSWLEAKAALLVYSRAAVAARL